MPFVNSKLNVYSIDILDIERLVSEKWAINQTEVRGQKVDYIKG